jgi:hypothetical protein
VLAGDKLPLTDSIPMKSNRLFVASCPANAPGASAIVTTVHISQKTTKFDLSCRAPPQADQAFLSFKKENDEIGKT